jgi:pimeloyl-ACP methyl ester carboxylesterase
MFATNIPQGICRKCQKQLLYDGCLEKRSLHSLFNSSEDNGQVVIIQHGINTYAHWYDPVLKCLNDNWFKTIAFKYGSFPIQKFIFHWRFSHSIKNKFLKIIRKAADDHPGADISVIAHSYGTLLITEILSENSNIYIDRLILVNSIIPCDFDWGDLHSKGRIQKVLNECACDDPFPIIAKKWIRDCGSSGVEGFITDDEFIINNYKDNAGHSTLLNADRCRDMWIPFLADTGTFLKEFSESSGPSKKALRLVSIINFLIWSCILIIIIFIVIFISKPTW